MNHPSIRMKQWNGAVIVAVNIDEPPIQAPPAGWEMGIGRGATAGINNPFVSPAQYRNTLGRFIESAGFKDTNEFFREITPEMEQQMMQQPTEPSPLTDQSGPVYPDRSRTGSL